VRALQPRRPHRFPAVSAAPLQAPAAWGYRPARCLTLPGRRPCRRRTKLLPRRRGRPTQWRGRRHRAPASSLRAPGAPGVFPVPGRRRRVSTCRRGCLDRRLGVVRDLAQPPAARRPLVPEASGPRRRIRRPAAPRPRWLERRRRPTSHPRGRCSLPRARRSRRRRPFRRRSRCHACLWRPRPKPRQRRRRRGPRRAQPASGPDGEVRRGAMKPRLLFDPASWRTTLMIRHLPNHFT